MQNELEEQHKKLSQQQLQQEQQELELLKQKQLIQEKQKLLEQQRQLEQQKQQQHLALYQSPQVYGNLSAPQNVNAMNQSNAYSAQPQSTTIYPTGVYQQPVNTGDGNIISVLLNESRQQSSEMRRSIDKVLDKVDGVSSKVILLIQRFKFSYHNAVTLEFVLI